MYIFKPLAVLMLLQTYSAFWIGDFIWIIVRDYIGKSWKKNHMTFSWKWKVKKWNDNLNQICAISSSVAVSCIKCIKSKNYDYTIFSLAFCFLKIIFINMIHPKYILLCIKTFWPWIRMGAFTPSNNWCSNLYADQMQNSP